MKNSKKIILITTFLFFIGGLFFYKLIYDNDLPKDLTGNYISITPNFLERKIIYKTHNIKGAYFTSNGEKKLFLKKDFTQTYIRYNVKGDSTVYQGNWEIKNDSLVLHFSESNFNICLTHLGFSNKLYHIRDVIPCKDSTAVKDVSVFKRE